jgi:hypothetical protein
MFNMVMRSRVAEILTVDVMQEEDARRTGGRELQLLEVQVVNEDYEIVEKWRRLSTGETLAEWSWGAPTPMTEDCRGFAEKALETAYEIAKLDETDREQRLREIDMVMRSMIRMGSGDWQSYLIEMLSETFMADGELADRQRTRERLESITEAMFAPMDATRVEDPDPSRMNREEIIDLCRRRPDIHQMAVGHGLIAEPDEPRSAEERRGAPRSADERRGVPRSAEERRGESKRRTPGGEQPKRRTPGEE